MWSVFLQIDMLDFTNIGTDTVLKCWKHRKSYELELYELCSQHLYKRINAWDLIYYELKRIRNQSFLNVKDGKWNYICIMKKSRF